MFCLIFTKVYIHGIWNLKNPNSQVISSVSHNFSNKYLWWHNDKGKLMNIARDLY